MDMQYKDIVGNLALRRDCAASLGKNAERNQIYFEGDSTVMWDTSYSFSDTN